MSINSKTLKTPRQLFEERELEKLAQLNKENEQIDAKSSLKKLLSPKYFFNEIVVDNTDNLVEESLHKDENQIVEEVISEENLYEKQIDELKIKINELENSILEEHDLTEIKELINLSQKSLSRRFLYR